MIKKIFIAVVLMGILVGCVTMQPKDNNTVTKDDSVNNEDKKEDTITREDTTKMKVTVYGADKEGFAGTALRGIGRGHSRHNAGG